MPPGTVKITPEKQQLIGVRVGVVEEKPVVQTIRLLGRVTADETRIYIINATIDGWITKTLPNSTGSLVKKNEVLAAFYSPEFLSAQQALLFALGSKDRVQTTGRENPAQKDQLTQFSINIRQYTDSLKSLGMGEAQIKEMIRARRYMEDIDITAPADGFIIARNISQGQRFDKGTELYRIGDLSRVWILADLFENEAELIKIKPGERVQVSLPYQGKTIQAKISDIIPQFSTSSRTLKVRLEADNPGFALKPDMFVDVEFPVTLPPAITVPAEAVLDSGMKQIVFVDRGRGFFEPRKVKTGWRFGDRVEIVEGLAPGERIVISGNFLIDSESRMKLAAAGMYGALGKDPVCGMDVDESKATALGRKSESLGKTYYFCADACKQQFDKNPDAYISKSSESRIKKAAAGMTEALGKDPVCGMDVDESKAEAAGRKTEYRGKVYYFCADMCKQQFDKNPDTYIK
jgi:RND family efflux transporter MFP subunit